MACLRASLSPAARSIYKYTTGLVVAALREFYRRVRRKTEFSNLIASWETRIRNQGAQSEYQNFADKLTRDQFIAGLISETLRVKLIGKDHMHRDTSQTRVILKEVVEVAKTFEATTYANQLMKTTRSNQEQVNYTCTEKLKGNVRSNHTLSLVRW